MLLLFPTYRSVECDGINRALHEQAYDFPLHVCRITMKGIFHPVFCFSISEEKHASFVHPIAPIIRNLLAEIFSICYAMVLHLCSALFIYMQLLKAILDSSNDAGTTGGWPPEDVEASRAPELPQRSPSPKLPGDHYKKDRRPMMSRGGRGGKTSCPFAFVAKQGDILMHARTSVPGIIRKHGSSRDNYGCMFRALTQT